MLAVVQVDLSWNIPIVGYELKPHIVVRRPDMTRTNEDVPESAPVDGHFLRYKWYRNDKKVLICSIHPTEQATVQCLECVRAKVPVAKSYHCSSKCFSHTWPRHQILHGRGASSMNESGNEGDPVATVTQRSGGETWHEVRRSKTYIPTAEDIGHALKFECAVVDLKTKLPVGKVNELETSWVIPVPSPIPRRLIPVNRAHLTERFHSEARDSTDTFTILSYNILADTYASRAKYNYCPLWALAWPYRKQNLMGEIIGYHADIICLQEVQSDHFEEFFAPQLDEHGYEAMFKSRTNEVYTGNVNTRDGCATFFRRDRFSQVMKQEFEFNKDAWQLIDQFFPSAHNRQTAVGRLVKDNVALVAVLESKFGRDKHNPGKQQLLSVANIHVNVLGYLKEVKLWQVYNFLKGLENITASGDIPMVVCGDFSSVPGSAAHHLLATGKFEPPYPVPVGDPLGILNISGRLNHQLPLVSAYSSFLRMNANPDLVNHRGRMNASMNEPLFTHCTGTFIDTVDYIIYSADALTVEGLLELLDEARVREDTALPSPKWSSDHIALLAKFRRRSLRPLC